jgi:hypothetical protein
MPRPTPPTPYPTRKMSYSAIQYLDAQDLPRIRERYACRLALSRTPDGFKQTIWKTPEGDFYRIPCEPFKPDPNESISDEDDDEDEDEDEKQYEIVIDEMKQILLAPRFDFIKSETKAYDQIKRMAPKQMKRKVIILGAPSVGTSFFASFTRQTKANSTGKTSLTRQYIQPPTYVEGYFPTIEQTERKHIMYDGIDYDCEIIDTAGQVRLSPPSLP